MKDIIVPVLITAAVASLAYTITDDTGTLFTAVNNVVQGVADTLNSFITP